jgi:hypothetical protein
MATAGRISDRGDLVMARPEDTSLPHLAVGCKWAPLENPEAEFDPTIEATVLFPEGVIRVQGTGRSILELCDGEHSLLQIVEELQKQYILVSPTRIRDEAEQYLEKLQEKRIVDY